IMKILGRAQEAGVRIFTMPATVRGAGDSWIETIDLPEGIREQEPVLATVQVFSRVAATATVELLGGDAVLETKEVDLQPGLNPIDFEVRLTGEGPVTITGRLRTANDPFPQNDVLLQSITVGPRPRVLYIEGRATSAHYLYDALTGEGMEVELGQARDLPTSPEDYEQYDLVLISDVPSSRLNDAQMLSILIWVRDSGGGFIFAAGESSYGEEGYSDTPIEETLPIWFRVNEQRKDLALVIVMDKSFSMVGPKIELSKEAAKAALALLESTQRFGVVTFDHSPYWTVPLQMATNKERINEYISSIIASAHTNIYPALETAYETLAETEAEVRHVILLSDGKTYPDDYETLLNRMAEAEITVSTVAVGEEADRELLGNIAEWGNGRSYFIRDAQRVPQIFIEETQIAAQATLIEEPVETKITSPVEAFTGIDLAGAPSLRGYVSTQAKDTAEVLLESDAEAPILARWHYGLGKAAVFTSDVKNRWAADWIEWEGYGKFWSQLVRETMQRDNGDEIDFVVERVGDEAVVTVSAVTEEGTFRTGLEPRLEVIEPGGAGVVLQVDQVGPGTYQAKYPLHTSPDFPYLFRLSADDLDPQSRELFYAYADEHRLYPPNTELLVAVSEQTGGKVLPEPEEIFDDYGESASVPTPLWPFFAALGLLGYLLDIAMRRAPWFWRRFASTPAGAPR
ncbi:MAG: VWA domain-containing protein, partial [Acidobacteria bacterium]|nr:VWA domain-containing protein [Acidobacteriota bacterium]